MLDTHAPFYGHTSAREISMFETFIYTKQTYFEQNSKDDNMWPYNIIRGFEKLKIFLKNEVTMEVGGWVGPDLTLQSI